MRLIGITGGVGAGKSEVLSFIKKHYKCKIYLADEVAKEIQQPGQSCYEEIVALLGREVLGEDGRLDKGKVAGRIFLHKDLLLAVNDIVHPKVREYLETAIRHAKADGRVELFFIEAALLIENGYKSLVDEMWYVYAPDEVRRERLKKNRGYSDEKISRIMESQLAEKAFRENSDFIIDNSGTAGEAFNQIRKRLEAYTWQE